jgi:hypothetical protein
MRRDLLYLGAVIALAALLLRFGTGVLLGVIVPAWFARRGPLRPLWTAPLALIAVALVVPYAFTAFGADCPVEGVDNMDQCNTLAGAGIVLLYGGFIAVMVAAFTAVVALALRAGRTLLT